MKIHAGIKKKSNDICFKVYYLYSKKFKLVNLLILIKKSIYFLGKDYLVSFLLALKLKELASIPPASS